MHHDGFAMWDSELVEWNSMTSTARRDIAGELIGELRKRGPAHRLQPPPRAQPICGQYYGGRPDKAS